MKNPNKCRACGQPFDLDCRNRQRQSCCNRPECQRWRRTLSQRLRRQQQAAKRFRRATPLTPEQARRLQAASAISKADLRAEHPVLIGLLALVTGVDNFADLENIYRQLWLHGLEILSADGAQDLAHSHIIKLLEKSKGQNRKLG